MSKCYYLCILHGETNIGVTFPDFPGCVAHGATVDDALKNATDALQFHIDGMKADNEPLPIASFIKIPYLVKEYKEASYIYVVTVNV